MVITNNKINNGSIIRTEFKTSKLSGTTFIDSALQHILISDCTCKYLDIANSTVKFTEIERSNVDESSWFECRLEHLELTDVSLIKSDFYNN